MNHRNDDLKSTSRLFSEMAAWCRGNALRSAGKAVLFFVLAYLLADVAIQMVRAGDLLAYVTVVLSFFAGVLSASQCGNAAEQWLEASIAERRAAQAREKGK